MPNSNLPTKRAILWILVSTLLVSGSAFMGWLYYMHMRNQRLHNDQYRIVALVQQTPQIESLKTVYLAELMDLSLDRPQNLYQFNVEEAERRLLSCPLIKKASVKKIRPGTLYIYYEMRTPTAYLGDYTNTALDEEGVLFPFRPFFTPKCLPIFYLGLEPEEVKWGSSLFKHEHWQLASAVWNHFYQLALEKKSLFLKQVDVSQATADSYGQRQIVALVEHLNRDWSEENKSQQQFYLRLNSEYYFRGLANFEQLHCQLIEHETKKQPPHAKNIWIDLRIPHLAFIKQER